MAASNTSSSPCPAAIIRGITSPIPCPTIDVMPKHALVLAAVCLVLCGASGLKAQDEVRSIWSGVYTAQQADRGKAVYLDTCAGCHGAGLLGNDEIPPVKGPHFMSDWDTQ